MLTQLQKIALGTAILLTGVLALSWRLNQEPTNPPTSTASALSPGIGFIDTDSSEPSTDTEEERLEIDAGRQPASPSSLSTHDKFLKRRRTLSEVEEIWGELQDEGGLPRDEEEAGTDVDEGTSLLRKTPGGRKQVRRGTYMGRGGSSRSSRKERILQGAIGGWWKLKWWKEGKEGDSSRRRGQDDDGGDGGRGD